MDERKKLLLKELRNYIKYNIRGKKCHICGKKAHTLIYNIRLTIGMLQDSGNIGTIFKPICRKCQIFLRGKPTNPKPYQCIGCGRKVQNKDIGKSDRMCSDCLWLSKRSKSEIDKRKNKRQNQIDSGVFPANKCTRCGNIVRKWAVGKINRLCAKCRKIQQAKVHND